MLPPETPRTSARRGPPKCCQCQDQIFFAAGKRLIIGLDRYLFWQTNKYDEIGSKNERKTSPSEQDSIRCTYSITLYISPILLQAFAFGT